MSSSVEKVVPMRKRVAKACETCRAMKSKCDGRYPSCGKCIGYGYRCVYSESGRRSMKPKYRLDHPSPTSSASSPAANSATVSSLRDAVAEYEQLLQDAAPTLPEPERTKVMTTITSINGRVENAFSRLGGRDTPQTILKAESPPRRRPRSVTNSQRYLGEPSDVRFFNLVKRVLQEESPSERDEGMDSYEQDDADDAAACDASVDLPSPEVAERYLEIYFTTIHVAYPFIPRSSFMKTYRDVRERGVTEDIDFSWLALLHILFAIGAYYTSFPGASTSHEHHFHRALALSKVSVGERSVNRASFLLAQCFYLLAVCKTDRCWLILGHAVRIAQSIGLHVDPKVDTGSAEQAVVKAETYRRVWYSIYVLDRLLALQLGRPPAIHDDTCYIRLPSRLHDADVDWEDEHNQIAEPSGPTTGDYFLCVIALSKIIGYVLHDLYSPNSQRISTSGLKSTASLDKQLLEWKASLPRAMRFDFGHAFESSTIFKKQRNMLAIKFHHLRALIHRPYLSIPLLRDLDDDSMNLSQDERHTVERYERTCVTEAQGTAHLLRNVADQRELVYDFPWWQMISCLICASSILLVASIFTLRRRPSDEDGSVAVLDDDAETCLKVFEALSANSAGARMARDMMARLRECGNKWKDSQVRADVQDQPHFVNQLNTPQSEATIVTPGGDATPSMIPGQFEYAAGNSGVLFGAQEWPSEIMDSMAWSAQIFDAVHNYQYPPFT